ncbi:MAG: ABC transporter ATP-binding protein [Clostridiales bacterium]|nr:ABC transporter ATP-binding protein [Clostridiales bacterium]
MSAEHTERDVILSVRHVDITFSTGRKKKLTAVKDANFDIYRGETFALVGESGSGKTTLGRAIMRINPCSAGEILFEGKRISGKISREEDRNVIRNIQMIFQDPAASLNERATIEYCVSEGLYNFHLYQDEKDRIAKVDKALQDVGLLPEHKSRYPHEFSGGQRQRVGIARAMIMNPKFIVADEPISALDVSIRAQVLNLMNKLKAERDLTYLFIAHDLSVVRFIADRIAVIHLGEIVEIAESETLFKYPVHPYTVSLLSTVPMPDPVVERTRKHIVYDPSVLDQSGAPRSMRELRPGHFILATDAELEGYEKRIEALEAIRAKKDSQEELK